MKRFLLLLLILLFDCSTTNQNLKNPNHQIIKPTQNRVISTLKDKNAIQPDSLLYQPKDLDNGLKELSSQIKNSMLSSSKQKIALFPFIDNEDNITYLGKFLADELIDQLFNLKRFDIIERRLLITVLEEQKLSLTDLFDPNSTKKIGLILGADAITAGNYTVLSKSIRVRVRMIDVETGKVFAVAKTEILLDENINSLLKQNRWANATEEDKKKQYDYHINKASYFMERASQVREGSGYLGAPSYRDITRGYYNCRGQPQFPTKIELGQSYSPV